MNIKGWL